MNREIKFRGKMIPENEWIFGIILRIPAPPVCFGKSETDKYYIQFPDPRYMPDWNMPYKMVQGEVNADTIGQYTGLHDKNGKEIYEGDIVYCQTKFGKAKAIIKFIDAKFVAYWDSILTHPQNGHCIACYEINKRFEVIGNIYDNPELLGGE